MHMTSVMVPFHQSDIARRCNLSEYAFRIFRDRIIKYFSAVFHHKYLMMHCEYWMIVIVKRRIMIRSIIILFF
jgi:hypothetical protein